MDLGNLAHPEYLLFKQRLKSFTSWPPQLSQDKTVLAQAGLFYSNVSDRVVCFACGVNLYGWKSHDEPWIEHYKYARHCLYLNMVGNDRLSADKHDRPSYQMSQQERTTLSGASSELWTHSQGGLDSPDVWNARHYQRYYLLHGQRFICATHG